MPFDFISKSIYSINHSNPKRRLETPLKEALDDVIREVSKFLLEKYASKVQYGQQVVAAMT